MFSGVPSHADKYSDTEHPISPGDREMTPEEYDTIMSKSVIPKSITRNMSMTPSRLMSCLEGFHLRL